MKGGVCQSNPLKNAKILQKNRQARKGLGMIIFYCCFIASSA